MNHSRCAVVILEDNVDNILLYLRDDKPDISFPNTWALLGGVLREEESPEDGIWRELREELGQRDGTALELHDCEFMFAYQRRDIPRTEYVFRAPLTESVENLTLAEGRRLEMFSKSRIESSDNVAPHHKEILLLYFQKQHES